jgi:hypothetical protein
MSEVEKAIDLGEKFARFLARTLGTVPEDAVGALGGDWLRHYRIQNLHRLQEKTESILIKDSIDYKDSSASPRIALDIFRAAAEESDDILQGIWAQLMASAIKNRKNSLVRKYFIEVVKKLEPIDAVILDRISEIYQSQDNGMYFSKVDDDELTNLVRIHTDVTKDQVIFSTSYMEKELGLITSVSQIVENPNGITDDDYLVDPDNGDKVYIPKPYYKTIGFSFTLAGYELMRACEKLRGPYPYLQADLEQDLHRH